MIDARTRRIRDLLEHLPGGSAGIDHLLEPEATEVNDRVMTLCCDRDLLVASFRDALKAPRHEYADPEGWDQLHALVTSMDRDKDVLIATDLYGFFRVPCSRLRDFVRAPLWSHGIYVIGPRFDWLVGFESERVLLQGIAAPEDQ